MFLLAANHPQDAKIKNIVIRYKESYYRVRHIFPVVLAGKNLRPYFFFFFIFCCH